MSSRNYGWFMVHVNVFDDEAGYKSMRWNAMQWSMFPVEDL